MNIPSAYKYFFYRNYEQQIRMFGNVVPKLSSFFTSTLLLFFNLLTLLAWFQIISGYKFRIELPYAIVGSLGLLLLNYFFLIYSNKSDVIIDEFESETEIQRKKRAVWCWIYELGSFAAFFSSIFILSPGSK